MITHSVLDIAQFRELFAQFESVLSYPNFMLSSHYAMAGNYMSQGDSLCGGLQGDGLVYALQLMTAHLLALRDQAMSGGGASGFVTSASEGDVSVSIAPPPVTSGWKSWLASTPYGMQLWSLLSAKAAGGFSVGGLPERYALRKVGGWY